MTQNIIFIDRRKGCDRRYQKDPCHDLPLDLYHRKRRKSIERRNTSRSLADDYYAFYYKQTQLSQKKRKK